jgi:GDSL-like Lipase/Acylhydrolase family
LRRRDHFETDAGQAFRPDGIYKPCPVSALGQAGKPDLRGFDAGIQPEKVSDMIFAGCSLEYLLGLAGFWLAMVVGIAVFMRGRPWKSPRRWVRRAAGPLLAIWTLVFCMVLAETVFVISYDSTDAFSLSKISQRWYDRHVRRNNFGFRDVKDFIPTKQQKQRILLLGDSFAFGHGVANPADRFGDLLEARLHDAAPNWEIYNVTVPGFGTTSELELLDKLKQNGFEYDTILLAYCLNDAEDLSDGTKKTVGTIILDYPPNWLVRESYLLNFLYYRYKQFSRPEIRRYFHWIGYVYEGDMWLKQQSRLDRLHERCRERGVELMVVTFPFLYDLGPGYEFSAAHKTLDEYWKSRGVPHLDLLEILRQHKDDGLVVNRFDSHPNERAHALAADAIWISLLEPRLKSLDSAADGVREKPTR